MGLNKIEKIKNSIKNNFYYCIALHFEVVSHFKIYINNKLQSFSGALSNFCRSLPKVIKIW